MSSPIDLLNEAFADQEHKIRDLEFRLEENLARKILDLEDIGWTKLGGQSTDGTGLTLDALHNIVPNLRDMAAVNPWHVRGSQLRHSYVFGRGVNFEGITPKTQTVVDDFYNQTALFSVEAHETMNLALFTDGNLFVTRDKENHFGLVPIEQIQAEVTDPYDPSKVRYFLRVWNSVDGSGRGVVKKKWYPLARYKRSQVGRGKRGSIRKTIKISGETVAVDQEAVIYHRTTKRQAGWTYGVPDSLAASIWTVAYAEYLRDNASLVKALSQIAWSITTASKKGNANAAVAMAKPGVGGTTIMGEGNALSSVGVPSAQVDFGKGQPLIAAVAASFGVPVIALLASPGSTGGSYGAAETLTDPSIKGFNAVQDSWKVFYQEILSDLGSPTVKTSFPNISTDATYREAQTLATGYATGAISQAEYRDAYTDLVDVTKLSESLPKPDSFNAGKDPADATDPTPSQGNTGAVPGGVSQGDTDHSADSE